MAEVTQEKTIIKLSREEKIMLDDLLNQLFDYFTMNASIGEVMNDIYDAEMPKAGKRNTYNGDTCIVVIE